MSALGFPSGGGANSFGEAMNVAMGLLRYNSQDPEALVLRGRALYAQGENDKAIQHFRKALSCDPDFKDGVKWLRTVQKLDRMKEEGNVDYKAGRWEAAFNKYSAALDVLIHLLATNYSDDLERRKDSEGGFTLVLNSQTMLI